MVQVGHYLGQPVFADVPVTTSLYRTHPQQRRFAPDLRDTSLARRIANVLRFDKGITEKEFLEPCDSTGYVHAPYPGAEHRLTKGHDAGFHNLVKRFGLRDAFFIYNAERMSKWKGVSVEPEGGILAEWVGGKTVTILVNIANGKSKKGMKLRATLIVATSAQVPRFHEVFNSHGRKHHWVVSRVATDVQSTPILDWRNESANKRFRSLLKESSIDIEQHPDACDTPTHLLQPQLASPDLDDDEDRQSVSEGPVWLT
ncbi:hypothetical protein LTR56_027501 [Elasticomyces elasticus]|nr:hypothetical protein LTR56_027501 [Elasticomyces elasticus]